MELIQSVMTGDCSVIDVGAGASTLVDHLLANGYHDITLLEIARAALDNTVTRLGTDVRVHTVVADVTTWQPPRTYDIWHDRAVFHFLTDKDQQDAYVATAACAVRPGGHLIVGTFGTDGPTTCSGLAVQHYHHDTLAAAFNRDFALLSTAEEHHQTPWGSDQHFVFVVMRRR